MRQNGPSIRRRYFQPRRRRLMPGRPPSPPDVTAVTLARAPSVRCTPRMTTRRRVAVVVACTTRPSVNRMRTVYRAASTTRGHVTTAAPVVRAMRTCRPALRRGRCRTHRAWQALSSTDRVTPFLEAPWRRGLLAAGTVSAGTWRLSRGRQNSERSCSKIGASINPATERTVPCSFAPAASPS